MIGFYTTAALFRLFSHIMTVAYRDLLRTAANAPHRNTDTHFTNLILGSLERCGVIVLTFLICATEPITLCAFTAVVYLLLLDNASDAVLLITLPGIMFVGSFVMATVEPMQGVLYRVMIFRLLSSRGIDPRFFCDQIVQIPVLMYY
ncbi:hypothetical protein BD410DRAFT_386957 [Rickenella mellea]|uniref:Uncharacterized protein n=1 Tax=Rickenella mellea TaxID=50990 RepID=A0A4Y7PYR3_9AGAM|nr:hypothetical protein BD410DRAFT_386957 [Rickenella mellea]